MAKAMASSMVMRMEMIGRWEAAACGRRLLAIGGRGNEEDEGKTALMMNRAMEMPHQCDNQPACKGREAQADNGSLKRNGGNNRAG